MDGLVFDAYSTLYDAHSVVQRCESSFPGKGAQLSQLSRAKQLACTDDLEAERVRLIARGVAAGPARHKDSLETWAGGWSPGLDPQRRDYASFADFIDPDGNSWDLQQRDHRRNLGD